MARLVSNNFHRQIIALTLIGICVLATISQSSARYLPTRADETQLKHIIQVLRGLMDLSPESLADYGRTAYEYQSPSGTQMVKRDVHSANGLTRNHITRHHQKMIA